MIIHTTDNPISSVIWLETIATRVHQQGLTYVDLLIDQARTNLNQKLGQNSGLIEQNILLKNSPHSDAASVGPILCRIQVAGLPSIYKHLENTKDAALVLIGAEDFYSLSQRLSICLHAAWDNGLSKGILRYYDPRLTQAIAKILDEQSNNLLFGAAKEWHWINRDQKACHLEHPYISNFATDIDQLLLDEKQVQYLSAWHLAETWRLNEGLTPSAFQCDSPESLMQNLVKAHLAADQAQIWAYEARREFIQQALLASKTFT